MITTTVFDTKPYDREHLQPANGGCGIAWRFLEFRLSRVTVPTARGARRPHHDFQPGSAHYRQTLR